MTRDRCRGFTLIELMVVIGVILLLMSIAVISYQKLDKVAGEKSTNTRLALCASILSEYETAATLNAVEGPGGLFGVGSQIGAPGNVNIGAGGRYGGNISQTAAVFNILLQIPASKSMIGQLPGNAMLTANTTTQGTVTGWFDGNGNPLPVVVDGWKNPIVFVPSGGMSGVVIGKQIASSLQTALPQGTTMVVRSVDHRPFWASAGQDGNFSTGDDNLYSCQVVYTLK